MTSILHEIEKINYSEEKFKKSDYWKENLDTYFNNLFIDDLTDLNYSTCLTYLITLSDINKSLFSKKSDILLESNDLYFLEVLISIEKPLVTFHFWKYLKKENGIDKGILVSSVPYLKEHDIYYKKIIKFITDNNLLFISTINLKTKVLAEQTPVSLYYKYFNQEGENKLMVPY